MQAKLLKMAKGSSGESTGGSHQAQVEASPHMSVARSQATATTASPARELGSSEKASGRAITPRYEEKAGGTLQEKHAFYDEIICNAQNFITFTKDK